MHQRNASNADTGVRREQLSGTRPRACIRGDGKCHEAETLHRERTACRLAVRHLRVSVAVSPWGQFVFQFGTWFVPDELGLLWWPDQTRVEWRGGNGHGGWSPLPPPVKSPRAPKPAWVYTKTTYLSARDATTFQLKADEMAQVALVSTGRSARRARPRRAAPPSSFTPPEEEPRVEPPPPPAKKKKVKAKKR
jgi:hypothetical protein